MTTKTDKKPTTRPGLPLPQFRLITLMLLMALLSAVFALSSALGPYGTFWLVVFICAALAHIAGNALGTRLRERGSHPEVDQDPAGTFDPRRSAAIPFTPATRLGERSSLGLPILLATVFGVVAGGGMTAYWMLTYTSLTTASVVVAVVAFATLGGIWTFLMIGFLQVTITALIHALRESKR